MSTERGFSEPVERGLKGRSRNALAQAMRGLVRWHRHTDGCEWAGKFRVMQGRRGAGRRWSNAMTPYLLEPAKFLADEDPAHRVIVLSKCAQAGGSELALNEVLRRIHQEPCPILYYMETGDKCKSWMVERFDPALRRDPFAGLRADHSGRLERRFPGGLLIGNGAHSSAALSSITAKLVIGDEAARYPESISGEGDFLSLAKQRVVTYGREGKILIVSTPKDSMVGEGTFTSYIDGGDRREYRCPCPECGDPFTWGLEHFKRLDDGECVMVCPECGGMTHDGDERTKAVLDGGWVATKEPEEYGMVSYLLSGFVVPAKWRPWLDIWSEHDAALKGRKSLQAFHNTTLGEPFDEPEARVPEPKSVEALMKSVHYKQGHLPDKVAILTMGVDVQKGWLAMEVKGWSENMESWAIERENPLVDMVSDPQACAREIQKMMRKRYKFSDGGSLSVAMCCVDVGKWPTQIDEAIKTINPLLVNWNGGWDMLPHGTAVGCKGGSSLDPEQLLIRPPGSTVRRGRRKKFRHWLTGTLIAKRELYQTLAKLATLKDPKADVHSRPHAPDDYSLDVFKEIVAERVISHVNKFGKRNIIFKEIPRRSNEALDLHVLNRVAAEILKLPQAGEKDWERMRRKVDRGGSGDLPKDRAERKARHDEGMAQRRESWARRRNK